MIICLFGATYCEGRDEELERTLDEMLHERLRTIDGFISYHVYTADDGEVLGVVRFKTRQALEAWRDDPIHRSVWSRAPELYESFWIQNCETYRQYGWARGRRTGEDMDTRFLNDRPSLIPAQP